MRTAAVPVNDHIVCHPGSRTDLALVHQEFQLLELLV